MDNSISIPILDIQKISLRDRITYMVDVTHKVKLISLANIFIYKLSNFNKL